MFVQYFSTFFIAWVRLMQYVYFLTSHYIFIQIPHWESQVPKIQWFLHMVMTKVPVESDLV